MSANSSPRLADEMTSFCGCGPLAMQWLKHCAVTRWRAGSTMPPLLSPPGGRGVVSGDDIVERLRRWDDGRISTHWAGCMDAHPECAILFAVAASNVWPTAS